MKTTKKVVVSNGFNRFHLMHAAAELDRLGELATCFTGFYPSPFWKTCLKATRLNQVARFSQLNDRGVSLRKGRMVAMPWIEALNAVGTSLGSEWLKTSARHAFARRAAKRLPRLGASIFHYRSGFGHHAVKTAKAHGMIALCDHSIAHPDMVEFLVNHQGRYPRAHEIPHLGPLWRDIASDVRQADATLVVSDFVRDTFIQRGYDPSRLHVIYLGVDDNFVTCLDDLIARGWPPPKTDDSLRLTFAGTISRRKGVPELAQALEGLSDLPWTLDLIGPVDDDISSDHASFLKDPRVRLKGVVSRHDLAKNLLAADILLFPSLAEGSARVVFDALAAGCYVITTKNAGSIVQDNVHGALVAPGDVRAIQHALYAAAADEDRMVAIGEANARELRRDWRQSQYGGKLKVLYEELLSKAPIRPSKAP
ncbi:MAG: glycosyltransferase family 4 protein, partial [Pseudomonadota bacterium]